MNPELTDHHRQALAVRMGVRQLAMTGWLEDEQHPVAEREEGVA